MIIPKQITKSIYKVIRCKMRDRAGYAVKITSRVRMAKFHQTLSGILPILSLKSSCQPPRTNHLRTLSIHRQIFRALKRLMSMSPLNLSLIHCSISIQSPCKSRFFKRKRFLDNQAPQLCFYLRT